MFLVISHVPIWQGLKISFDIISFVISICSGIPASQIRWYVSINLATIERTV